MDHENGQAPAATIAAEDRRTEIDNDGFIFDSNSGEVLGHTGAICDDGFRIMSSEGSDWVLEKLTYEEAQIRKVEALRAAMNANLDSMLVEPRNRIAWLHRRFDGELIEQALRDLAAAGNRSKTAKYQHGRVSLRKTAGSAEITDRILAVEYVAEWCPDHVKRSVGIEGVRAAIQAEADAVEEAEDRTDTARFFRAAEPSERWSIDTGIGAGKGAGG